MTTPAPPAADRIVPVLHLALTAAPVFFAVAVGFVISVRPMPPVGGNAIQLALVGVAVALLVTATLVGQRIPPRRKEQDRDAYWRATLPRAVVLWAVLEAAGFTAGVAGLLSGRILVPLFGVLAFLVLMILYAPGRLAGD